MSSVNSFILLLTAVAATCVLAQDTMPLVSFDFLLKNRAYVINQVACIAKKNLNVCDRAGKHVRDVLMPDAAADGVCDSCDEQERIFMGKAAYMLQKKYPVEYRKLLDAFNVAPHLRPTFLQKEIAATTHT